MIAPQKISHIGIAVPDLDAAVRTFKQQFGGTASPPIDVPAQGVRMVYLSIADMVLELLSPLSDKSPLNGFLKKNPAGGLHHIAFRVADAQEAAQSAAAEGLGIVGPGRPTPGHHGRPIFFLHPKSTCGVLVEIEEAAR
ncbi:methylmalonyl-CoA epimerase [Ancylobacter sp. Lp-2]|uniref:methylmalonyl-CoA epimerase n=1 Tax=Ancylobacter sp. Lp-2 TaxID=2881339 RepID=UPI001E45040B|nr:methylmalonyl-CoA epimerase [Ancylobacter sp. Lp-2]MCB4770402.1 methylmalonyl-CoA epimerase [Ancylobacter sp. Lp-2]